MHVGANGGRQAWPQAWAQAWAQGWAQACTAVQAGDRVTPGPTASGMRRRSHRTWPLSATVIGSMFAFLLSMD